MNTKEEKLQELEKQLLYIQNQINLVNGEQDNFELIEVTPDCCGGIRNHERTLAISEDKEKLKNYCLDNFNYLPLFFDGSSYPKKSNDGTNPCDIWYRIRITKIQLV